MKSLFGCAAAAACLAATLAAQQQPVFRARGDVVRVFATVTGRDGRLVTTLEQANFEVRDEGKPQPITQFTNTPLPIRLVVLLDVSGSMVGNLPLLRDAADQLFARLLPEDLARVGTFGDQVILSPVFTRDRAELRGALPDAISSTAPTPLWRAMDQAMNAFGEVGDERRVILVLSDGQDTEPPSFTKVPISQGEIIDRARRDDVMVYVVAMRSRRRQPPPMELGPGAGQTNLQTMLLADLPDPKLARVAEETGGGYIEIRPGQNLAAAFTGVADELHSQYLLGFAPPKRDGKTHDISVRVNVDGLKPRARKTYVAPKS